MSFAIFLLSSLSSSVLSALLLFSLVPHHSFTQSSFLASFLLHLHSVFTISASFLPFFIHSLHPFLTASTHSYLHSSSNFTSSSFCSHHLIYLCIFLSSFILFSAPPNIIFTLFLRFRFSSSVGPFLNELKVFLLNININGTTFTFQSTSREVSR